MITAKGKDRLLCDLINAGMRFLIEYSPEKNNYLTRDEFFAVLDQFQDLGLLSQQKFIGGIINISIKAKAHDVFNQGGFTAQEEILKANIEKLNLELLSLSKNLEPNLLEKAANISAIGSAIISGLALFKH
nr:MAG TPA: hypothetical protein [Caudoviricetes sp.]